MLNDLSPAGLRSLPAVKLADRAKLPKVTAVYFALPPAPQPPLYIGSAVNLAGRWRGHHHLSRLLELGDITIAWMPLPLGVVRQVESALIRLFQPKLNGPQVERYVRVSPFRVRASGVDCTMDSAQEAFALARALAHEHGLTRVTGRDGRMILTIEKGEEA